MGPRGNETPRASGPCPADYELAVGIRYTDRARRPYTREFRARFRSMAANRKTERLSSLQIGAAEGTGGAGFFSHSGTGSALAGADFERVRGIQHGPACSHWYGVRRRLARAARRFRSGDPENRPGAMVRRCSRELDRAAESSFSARMAVWRQRPGRFRFRGSVLPRVPSADAERLYREFRAGNAPTLPNAALKPETDFGGGGGDRLHFGEQPLLRHRVS